MAPTGRCQRVVPIPRDSIENSLQKIVKTFKRDATIGSIEMNLLNTYSGPVGGMARTARRRRGITPPRGSIENSLRELVKTFESNLTIRSVDTDLLSRYSGHTGGMATTGRRRRVVPIPRHSLETASRNL